MSPPQDHQEATSSQKHLEFSASFNWASAQQCSPPPKESQGSAYSSGSCLELWGFRFNSEAKSHSWHKAWGFQALTAGSYEASLSYYSSQIFKDPEIEAICTPDRHSSLVWKNPSRILNRWIILCLHFSFICRPTTCVNRLTEMWQTILHIYVASRPPPAYLLVSYYRNWSQVETTQDKKTWSWFLSSGFWLA